MKAAAASKVSVEVSRRDPRPLATVNETSTASAQAEHLGIG